MTSAPEGTAVLAPWSVDPPAVRILPATRSHLGVPFATVPGWRPIRLDLHVPDAHGPHPVVVYAHGGSWTGGMPDHGPWHTLPRRGIAVASVAYRLAHEVTFPEPVEDLRAAIRWVRSRAGRYDLDPDRVALWGSSAGAYLATMAALSGDRPLGRPVGECGEAADVSAVVDHYGPADLGRLPDDAAPEVRAAVAAVVDRFLGRSPGNEGATELTDPLRLAGPQAPPFLIVHGDADRQVGLRQSRWLHDGLQAAGVGSELAVLAGAGHTDPVFFSRPEIDRVVRFLHASW